MSKVYLPEIVSFNNEVKKELGLDCAYLHSVIWTFCGMSKEKKKCYLTDKQFAELVGVSPRTIQRNLKSLSEAGWIIIKTKKNEKNILVRDIFIAGSVTDDNGGVSTPVTIGIDTRDDRGIDTSGEYNYINNNNYINTSNIITRLPEESQAEDSEKEVVERKTSKEYEEYLQMFNEIRGSSFRGDKKSKRAFKGARDKYEMEELKKALEGAMSDEYHKSVNYKYITPEFMLREDKIEKFLEVYRGLKLDVKAELAEMIKRKDEYSELNNKYHRGLIPVDIYYEQNLHKLEAALKEIKEFKKKHGL